MTDLNRFFEKSELIPAIVQDASTGEVLMLAYMNAESLRLTLETRKCTFFSRSRGRLWTKGETSGHFMNVVEIFYDCDCDTRLVKANPAGPACHTGNRTCFYRRLDENRLYGKGERNMKNETFDALAAVIRDRKKNPAEGSYTCYLFEKGLDKILKKVGEEASEVIIAAKNGANDELCMEVATCCSTCLSSARIRTCPWRISTPSWKRAAKRLAISSR